MRPNNGPLLRLVHLRRAQRVCARHLVALDRCVEVCPPETNQAERRREGRPPSRGPRSAATPSTTPTPRGGMACDDSSVLPVWFGFLDLPKAAINGSGSFIFRDVWGPPLVPARTGCARPSTAASRGTSSSRSSSACGPISLTRRPGCFAIPTRGSRLSEAVRRAARRTRGQGRCYATGPSCSIGARAACRPAEPRIRSKKGFDLLSTHAAA